MTTRVENTFDRDVVLPNGPTVPMGRAAGLEKRRWEMTRRAPDIALLLSRGHLVASDKDISKTVVAVPASPDVDRFERATRDQIKAQLDATGIEYESRAALAELQAVAREKLVG